MQQCVRIVLRTGAIIRQIMLESLRIGAEHTIFNLLEGMFFVLKNEIVSHFRIDLYHRRLLWNSIALENIVMTDVSLKAT